MKIPLPTQIMLEASYIVRTYWWMAAAVGGRAADRLARLHEHARRGASGGTARG